MNTRLYLKLALAGCLSCVLGACALAEPDEVDGDEPVTMSTEEDGMQSTAVNTGGGEEEDAVGCNGYGNWCLVKCSKSGNMQHVVGTWNQLNGACVTPGEAFCKSHKLGYRTHACWGYVNNN